MDGPVEDIGSRSCVTRFVKTLLSIMEHGVKPHSKHLTEYFAFLYEFAKMGEEEVSVSYDRISKTVIKFYLANVLFDCFTESVPVVTTSHLHHGAFLHGNQRPRECKFTHCFVYCYLNGTYFICFLLAYVKLLMIHKIKAA